MTAKHGDPDVAEGFPRPEDSRKPDSPIDLTKPSWKFVLRKTAREFSDDECTDLAAGLTYYAVLSLFPALLVVVSLLGVFGQGGTTVDTVLQLVEDLGPTDAVNTLRGPVEQLVQAPTAGLALILGIAGALWSASGYVGAFGRAMNRIYEIEEGRPIWKLRPWMLLITALALIAMGATALMLVVSGPIARAVGDVIGFGETSVTIWSIAKWPVILLLVIMIIAVLYYATPNVSQPKFRWISLGATIAIVTWIVASLAFAFYVSNFGSYNKTYGSLAGAIVFLLWLWITNLALLFGAEFDAELERGRQLQAGIEAEETLQLPPRDTRNIEKNEEKRQEDIERGRELRLAHTVSGRESADDAEGDRPAPEVARPPEVARHGKDSTMTASPGGTPSATDPSELSTAQLTERLTTQVSMLVRTEVGHALDEVKAKGTRIGVGVGISGAGLMLIYLGIGALIATAILGLATVLSPWLAALIVSLVVLAIGGTLAAVGASRAKNSAPPVPSETVESVRKDVNTVKEHVR
ncbi:YhjD/YihY/BrkB family envelope integrity protein [Rhodococcus rhodochrous]|uniref:Transposon TnsA n=1 Tax=Rhodococcus rhodochrous KG-21 TaxID=1441923 RepID=A0A0M8PN07_RHORH|nr:YhjD/YihY/BrkB family envelope integrity protein [Rhodococcus rhodochrous]KOS56012.1 transposon TnsA [Rhodococcus rhodochrous KG-21]